MLNYTDNELAKITENGISNLMYIFAFDLKAKIPDTLSALETLPLNDLSALFKQVDEEGNNVIMLSMWGSFEAANNLLDIFKKLPPHDKLARLTQANNEGETALMIATQKNPRLVPKLLNLIEELPAAAPATIVKQVDTTPSDPIISIGNALMWILSFCDAKTIAPNEVMAPFSRLFNHLATNDKTTVLQQINKEGENAVLLAVKYNQDYLPAILELSEKTTNPTMIAQTLKQVDGMNICEKAIGYTWRNALQHAIISQSKQPRTPNPVLIILTAIFKLSPTLQKGIIEKFNDEESISLINAVKSESDQLKLLELFVRFNPDKLTRYTDTPELLLQLSQLYQQNENLRTKALGSNHAGNSASPLEIDMLAIRLSGNRNSLFYSNFLHASTQAVRTITPVISSKGTTSLTPLTPQLDI
ncbi:MAG: hypothetical protein A3F46_04175 [Legionellales bacterium RIFCSPHIGHO2_12_FULL_42_9]|nr:MAG: hypothetical protein A3F46_04175 [Legionellales bacterium RIFCSPHIGHO2_12_FULL_42_9]